MDQISNRNNSTTGNSTASGNSTRVEGAASTAHQTVDKLADGATAQVDRMSGSVHRAVNKTADAASAAAEWAATVPDQARQMTDTLTESACSSIRARPLTTVAGALAVGYLLGRIARM